MKGEDLFNAIGQIDDRFIEKASADKIHIFQKDIVRRAVAVAACVCLLVVGYSVTSILTAGDGNLPKIDYTIHFEGMGYEGSDELSMQNSDDINPWNESVVLDTLPVYKNLCYNEGKLSQTYFDVVELKEQCQELADKLGAKYYSPQISISGEEEVYGFSLETEKGPIKAFPKGSNITVNKEESYLTQKHMQIVCNKTDDNEAATGVYREYSIDGELLGTKTRSYYKSDNIVDNIVSFNMQSYYLNQNGNYITGNSENHLNGSEKLGDYPVISPGQAREKLFRGEYINSAVVYYIEGGKITEDVVAKVDLIYYTTGNQEYYLPYYRFYVRTYSGDSDIQRYGYVYVCAIEDEYLGEVTIFDGSLQ